MKKVLNDFKSGFLFLFRFHRIEIHINNYKNQIKFDWNKWYSYIFLVQFLTFGHGNQTRSKEARRGQTKSDDFIYI